MMVFLANIGGHLLKLNIKTRKWVTSQATYILIKRQIFPCLEVTQCLHVIKS